MYQSVIDRYMVILENEYNLHSAFVKLANQVLHYYVNCLSNAMHGTRRYKITWVYDCVCVCPKYLSCMIVIAVFVQSSENLECRSHIWQWRVNSTANNTGNSKRACTSNYFQFCSLLGLCPHFSSDFFSNFVCRFILPRTNCFGGITGSDLCACV